jgi:hypothetical protein
VQNALQHAQIKGLFIAKIVVQIGFGQVGGIGNLLHGGAAKSITGEDPFGCGHNDRLVILANTPFLQRDRNAAQQAFVHDRLQ